MASPSGSGSPAESFRESRLLSPLEVSSESLGLHTTTSGSSTIRATAGSPEDPSTYSSSGRTRQWFLAGNALEQQRPTTAPPDGPRVDRAEMRDTLSRTSSLPFVETEPIPPVSPRQTRQAPLRTRAQSTASPPLSARYVPVPSTPPLRQNASRLRQGFVASYPPSPSSSLHSSSTTPSNDKERPLLSASLQSHIYESGLLQSTLSDVSLVAFNRFYRLHRIILNQSGFFASLLSGGFAEERRGAQNEVIEVKMESPLTRAAFEFAIARLYAGGPELCAIPTAKVNSAYPLSEAFETIKSRCFSLDRGTGPSSVGVEGLSLIGKVQDWEELEKENVEPATSTFLIALLSVASYLEIPSLQKTALLMINATITPWTVGQYLGFALGDGLGSATNGIDIDHGCRGLEEVGIPYRIPTTASVESDSAASLSSSTSPSDQSPSHFVGPEGEAVGEACACFLAKWGYDIFRVEEWLANHDTPERDTNDLPRILQERPGLIPGSIRVWSSLPGGISSRFVRGIISSDAFFISNPGEETNATAGEGEWERYLFAKRVVEFRRNEQAGVRRMDLERRELAREKLKARENLARKLRNLAEGFGGLGIGGDGVGMDGGDDAKSTDSDGKETECPEEEDYSREWENEGESVVVDEDEVEYAELFATGIYYSQLTFQQLRFIANDFSPTTGAPYVPHSIIQEAFWHAEEFKARIPTISPSASHAGYATPLRPPAETDTTDLNLSTLIRADLNPKPGVPTRRYFLVPSDDTSRINDNQIPFHDDVTPSPITPSTVSAGGAETFFGLLAQSRLGISGPNPAVFGTKEEEEMGRVWVAQQPFRISASFYNVGELREKQRCYSKTFEYGYSSWNVYVQKILKKGSKGPQLGIYLHRQNQLEAFPTPSRATVLSTGGSAFQGGSPPPTLRDKRKGVQAYFEIYCSNQLGNSLTKFSSAPDTYQTSQSWGFKSSSLRSEEYLGPVNVVEGGVGSVLRVSIVMGVI